MSTVQLRWILAGSLLSALAGCEVDVIDCEKEPEADICQDDPEDEDAGDEDESDADVDGGKPLDGGADSGKNDGSTGDAGTDGGAGSDGETDADTDQPITIDEFCVAQLSRAVAWRDGLEGLCGSMEQAARDSFLQRVLAYAPDDAEGKCITARKAVVDSGNATFDGSKAMACADAFTKNFAAPPDPFPTTGGIDLAMYESKIAHGAPALVQIPECRATFKGKLARDKVCTDNFECVDGLRCLDAPGGTKTCQTALVGGTCVQSSNCADGYTCVGSATSGGGKTCVKNDALPLSGGNCQFSAECAEDLVCTAGKCAAPVAQVICK